MLAGATIIQGQHLLLYYQRRQASLGSFSTTVGDHVGNLSIVIFVALNTTGKTHMKNTGLGIRMEHPQMHLLGLWLGE